MSRLAWDETGKKTVETGLNQGVLYLFDDNGNYGNGVAWSGLTSINENPSGAEPTDLYADNIKFMSLYSAEDFGGTIEAYMYPDEFAACNGEESIAEGVTISQQARAGFGLSYKTLISNDVKGNAYGYKLHMVYGCKCSPSEMSRQTVNDSPEASTMSWEFTTTPVNVTGKNPTAHLVIDSTKIGPKALKAIEDILYGTDSTEAKLPTPDEVLAIIQENPEG